MNCMQPKLLCAYNFDARPTLPATRRGSAVLDAAHAFDRSFNGQFTAASDVQRCTIPHSSKFGGNCDIFRGVARTGDIFRQQQREIS